VIVVHVQLGDVVPFQAVPDRDVVEPERFGQHQRGLPVTPRDVHPDQRIVPLQQILKVLGRDLLHPGVGDHMHVRVRAALNQKQVRLVMDALKTLVEVRNKLNGCVLEALELQVAQQRVLVACAGGA